MLAQRYPIQADSKSFIPETFWEAKHFHRCCKWHYQKTCLFFFLFEIGRRWQEIRQNRILVSNRSSSGAHFCRIPRDARSTSIRGKSEFFVLLSTTSVQIFSLHFIKFISFFKMENPNPILEHDTRIVYAVYVFPNISRITSDIEREMD